MKSDTRDMFTSRETILKLLSDEENARVSMSETIALSEGDEYIDLTRIDKGVLRADGMATPIGHVLPKKAVQDRTWSKILEQMNKPHSA